MDTTTAVEEIRARLGELVPDFWTAAEVLRALNSACTRFAMAEKWEWLWTVTSDTLTAGTTTMYLQPGVSPNRQFLLEGTFSGDTRPRHPRRVTPPEGVALRSRYYTPGNDPMVYFFVSQPDEGANEIQHLVNGGSTSGTFTITFDGQTTAVISRGATAADIRDALVALSNLGPADVRVYGGPLGTGAVYVEFRGVLAGVNVPAMTLGGTTTSMTVTTDTAGGSPSQLWSPVIEFLPELTRDFDITYTYLRLPRVLSAGSDVVDVPDEYTDAVLAKATARLWLKELRDSVKAQEQELEYMRVLDDAKRDQRKLVADEGFAWGKDEPQDFLGSDSDFTYRHFSGPLG
ncbi:MAG TPA: hypothetical protein VNN79_25450 [Actinomycetota bacterium]|nr:hypothetical protein [Actinomycetota bacterium]